MEGDLNKGTNMYQNVSNDPNKEVMSMGSWLVTLLIMMVPCVNIIMYFVWAFGNGNENRKNFCRAGLIMMAIVIVLYIILFISMGAMFTSALGY